MSKYKLSQNELWEHFYDQVRFIKSSVKLFDSGDEKEARRLATSLRIIFHNTNNSKSLINQLNIHLKYKWLSSGNSFTPSNLFSSLSLLKIEVLSDHLRYCPLGSNDLGRVFYLNYADWWNEVIFRYNDEYVSRKDLITFVANQDGGAHVDPLLSEKYSKLIKCNSLDIEDFGGCPPVNNPAYCAVRQVAEELLISLAIGKLKLLRRKTDSSREFEMRFVDQERRFKWSTTDITQSKETMSCVAKFKKQNRKYYRNIYENGKAIECISL